MNIHQFSMTYVPEQDRVLMRVSTVEGEELRLWLTRRLMARLWPVLANVQKDRLLKQDASAVVADAPAPLRDMLADFQKEKALQKSDFATPYREVPAPQRAEQPPLLVTHVEARPDPSGAMHLRLDERLGASDGERSLQLTLGGNEFHGVMHLLDQALELSQWRQGFSASAEEPAVAAEPVAPAEPEPPRTLN